MAPRSPHMIGTLLNTVEIISLHTQKKQTNMDKQQRNTDNSANIKK